MFEFLKGVANAFGEEVPSSLDSLQDYASITTTAARVHVGDSKETRDHHSMFSELHAILDNREQVLLQEAQEVVRRKLGLVDRQQEDLQLALTHASSC